MIRFWIVGNRSRNRRPELPHRRCGNETMPHCVTDDRGNPSTSGLEDLREYLARL